MVCPGLGVASTCALCCSPASAAPATPPPPRAGSADDAAERQRRREQAERNAAQLRLEAQAARALARGLRQAAATATATELTAAQDCDQSPTKALRLAPSALVAPTHAVGGTLLSERSPPSPNANSAAAAAAATQDAQR